MQLKEFVEKFVCQNSLVKLWKETTEGHELLRDGDRIVCMNWQLLKEDEEIWQKKYNDHEVIGVADILCDDSYREAINIVIKL